MKIVSYNVNGIRAAMSKNLAGWLETENPDIVCFQELKAMPEQFDTGVFENLGYHAYWHPAQKKGYSGVAILTRIKPNLVVTGCGNARIDEEGRILRADFDNFSIMSVYIPSGTSGDERQGFKMEFCEFFRDYTNDLLKEQPALVISGDVNICHHPIDIHDPVRNVKSSGFLPEERDWLGKFLEVGLTDSFRHLNPDKVKYSWWSFRSDARQKNKGWRIDYHLISEPLKGRLKHADILNDAVHSDHCPILLELN